MSFLSPVLANHQKDENAKHNKPVHHIAQYFDLSSVVVYVSDPDLEGVEVVADLALSRVVCYELVHEGGIGEFPV